MAFFSHSTLIMIHRITRLNFKRLEQLILSTFLTSVIPICASAQVCEIPAWAWKNQIQHELIGDVSCPQLASTYTLFNDLNTAYVNKAELHAPREFLLRLFNRNDRENFDSYRLEIALHHVSYDSNLKAISKTEQETLPIVIHEYGHAVLSSSLSQDLASFHALNLVDRSRSRLSHEYLNLQKTELKEAYSSAAKEYSRLRIVFEAVAPYHELFADLFAVNYIGEVQSIENAIFFKEKMKNGDAISGNFSNPSYPETWRSTESHVLFNPVRYFLWKNYLSPSASCNIAKHEKLAVIYQVIRHHIEALLNENVVESSPVDTQKLNRDLLSSFSKRFQMICFLK